jgi:membrane-bound serine protease (ClpP class)
MKRGTLLALAGTIFLACMWGPVRAAEGPTTNASAADRKAVVITLAGEINEYNRDALFRRFDDAKKLGAKVVILNIDTYGGLLTSGLEISRFIKRQGDLHVVAYVKDKAISAGAMIAMACDEIVVSDSATLGDCAPIIFGPEGVDAMPAAERAKAEGPVLTDFNESAIRNHRDPLLAAAMVDVTRVVYWVQNDHGERRFVDQAEYDKLTATKKWVSVPGEPCPIDGPTTLLTVDSEQAVRYGLASAKCSTLEAMADARRYDIVADLSPGWGENAVEFLSGAIVRGILIVVFLQCLYIVLHAPGHGVAEVCGLVALVLMLGVPLLTGYAQWWEILVIFLGLLLVSLEILLPGHLFPGITGGILVVFGLVMTFVPAGVGNPSMLPNHTNWPLMEKGIVVVAAAMASSVFLWFWLSRFLPKMPLLNRLILTATSGNRSATGPGAAEGPSPTADHWPPPGAVGNAVSELRPGGSAEFFDPAISDKRIAFVVSETGYLPAGTEIVVREVSGPSIVVRKRD